MLDCAASDAASPADPLLITCSSPAETEERREPIDPKLVTRPKDWNEFKTNEDGGFGFMKIVVAGSQVLSLKAIRVIDNNVFYYVKSKLITPSHLAGTANSIKELNDVLMYFDAASLCEGCPEKELMLLQHDSSSKVSAEGYKKTHCWRSHTCERIVVPGELKCPSCCGLTNLLKRKKNKSDSKMKKEKKSQVEIKNLRKKLQRSITQMMVLFGFLIKLHVK